MSKNKSKKFSTKTILINCCVIEAELIQKYISTVDKPEHELIYSIVLDYTDNLLKNLGITQEKS